MDETITEREIKKRKNTKKIKEKFPKRLWNCLNVREMYMLTVH